jgi:cyclohexadienyl dehydratase
MKRYNVRAVGLSSSLVHLIIAILCVFLLTTPVALAQQTAAVPAASQTPATLLDQIIAHGYIQIGMTGDYKPFTYLNPETNQFEGIDVDMANDLGKALGVEVKFVKTTWGTLMQDFQAGKFDIAMSGTAINMDRSKVAFFSIPYLKDGKTPITLKENAEKFQTLEQIDQAGVKVIVNPGGLNEKFVRANLKKAEIIVHPDNVTIFDQLLQKKADLMITDVVETLLQQKLHPELVSVHPETPFTVSEKAYMLPRDIVLKNFVDQWLHLAQMSGAYQKIYDKWMK